MNWLRRIFDPEVKMARLRAMAYVCACNPSFSVGSARFRAEEPSRYVFAVFYDEPGVWVTPGRYKLIAVDREGVAVEELETSPRSPHWIRGLK